MSLVLESGYVHLGRNDPEQVTIVSDNSILGHVMFHTNLEPFRVAVVRGWEVHFGGHDSFPLEENERVLFQVEVKKGFVYISRFVRLTNWNNAKKDLRRQLHEKRARSGRDSGKQAIKRFGRKKSDRKYYRW